MKIFRSVKVEYMSEYFDVEISDDEIEFAKRCGVNVEDDDDLLNFHLDNNFQEHQDLLYIDDYSYEEVESAGDENVTGN